MKFDISFSIPLISNIFSAFACEYIIINLVLSTEG